MLDNRDRTHLFSGLVRQGGDLRRERLVLAHCLAVQGQQTSQMPAGCLQVQEQQHLVMLTRRGLHSHGRKDWRHDGVKPGPIALCGRPAVAL